MTYPEIVTKINNIFDGITTFQQVKTAVWWCNRLVFKKAEFGATDLLELYEYIETKEAEAYGRLNQELQ